MGNSVGQTGAIWPASVILRVWDKDGNVPALNPGKLVEREHFPERVRKELN